jgi:hypothetical protein
MSLTSLGTSGPGQAHLGKHLHIELGVNQSGGERAMAKKVGDVFEARAAVQHLRGRAMPKRMNARMPQPGAPEEIRHDTSDMMVTALFGERGASGNEDLR